MKKSVYLSSLLLLMLFLINGVGFSLEKQASSSVVQSDADKKVDKDGRTPLMLACMYGKEKYVKEYLDNGSDADAKDYMDRPVIYWAIVGSNETIINLLLKKGVRLDFKDKDGKGILDYCSKLATPKITSLLTDELAKRNQGKGGEGTSNGINALTRAVMAGDIQEVKALLNSGADPNFRDNNGRTCLMLAAFANNVDIVKLLLISNADVSAKDNNGKTAYTYAKDLGYSNIAQAIQLFSPSTESTQPTKENNNSPKKPTVVTTDDVSSNNKPDKQTIEIARFRGTSATITLDKIIDTSLRESGLTFALFGVDDRQSVAVLLDLEAINELIAILKDANKRVIIPKKSIVLKGTAANKLIILYVEKAKQLVAGFYSPTNDEKRVVVGLEDDDIPRLVRVLELAKLQQ